jgi:glycosyltransferase involved in cell wall biosynthesis
MILSVVMITYGHESYIGEAINGVLMQNCDFEVELIIANDCSPDSTHDVVNNLINTHPKGNWIKYTRHNSNLGPMGNSIWAFSQAKGKYIAICEGDDFWTDSNKLQRQVDFLEKNQGFSITFTDYNILNENLKKIETAGLKNRFKTKNIFSLRDIIITNFIPTLTVVFRNNNVVFPGNNYKLFPVDWPLHILNAKTGKIKFLPYTTAVYRKHDGGICSSSKPLDNYYRYLETLKIIKSWFKGNFIIQSYFLISQARIYGSIVKYRLKVCLKKK